MRLAEVLYAVLVVVVLLIVVSWFFDLFRHPSIVDAMFGLLLIIFVLLLLACVVLVVLGDVSRRFYTVYLARFAAGVAPPSVAVGEPLPQPLGGGAHR